MCPSAHWNFESLLLSISIFCIERWVCRRGSQDPKTGSFGLRLAIFGLRLAIFGQGLAMFDIENGNVWSWLAMFSPGDGNE